MSWHSETSHRPKVDPTQDQGTSRFVVVMQLLARNENKTANLRGAFSSFKALKGLRESVHPHGPHVKCTSHAPPLGTLCQQPKCMASSLYTALSHLALIGASSRPHLLLLEDRETHELPQTRPRPHRVVAAQHKDRP